MAGIKITDLVDPKAIAELKDLQVELTTTKEQYIEIAKELSKGLNLKVEVVGDLEKLNEVVKNKAKEAQEATEKLNETVKKQSEIVANTTNTISRKLAEQEKLNKVEREAFEVGDRYHRLMEQINGSYEQRVKRLVQIENELKANKQAQKDLNDALEKGKITQEQAEAKMIELVKTSRELAQSKANLNTQLKNEEREMQSVKGSYNHLSQQLELLKKAYKSLTAAEREGTFGKEMESAIQDLDAHLKDLAADMGEFQRNVGNYAIANEGLADSLLEVIGLNSQFGSSLKALGENSAGSFIDGLKDKVKAFGSTLAGILKNKWILSFLGIAGAGAAFKWWYDYNKGLEKATRLTQQFTGLSGDELKKVRTDVASLADAYEKDFNEMLIAINAMAKQFGISFEESFQLVKDGFIAGADANGEFLENVKEYPAYFKEAGISAAEFIAITTQANQAGIYSDKGIDVIKEANLRIREMTSSTAEAIDGIGLSSAEIKMKLEAGLMSTFDVMKQISAKLAELPENSAAVGTAIADIFGGPGEDAGLQYLITLKDIDTSMDSVKEKAGELGALQEEQLNSQMALQEAIVGLFDATGGTFESLTASIKIFVTDTLASLIRGISKVINFVAQNKTAFLTFGGIVAGVTAIVNAHNIALALTAVRAKAVALAQGALNTVMSLGRAVLALMSAGYLACTGNIVAATFAMKAFNTAIKANPIGLLLSAISLLVTALIGLGDANDEVTESEKRRQEEMERTAQREQQIKEEVNRTAGAQIAAYKRLQTAWNELGDDLAKKEKFIKSNQKAFKDLGFEINNVKDAEAFFNKNTAKVCESFVLRAKSAALTAAMENVWAEYLKSRDLIIDDTNNMPRYKQGDEVPESEWKRVGGKGIIKTDMSSVYGYEDVTYKVVDEEAYFAAHNAEQGNRREKLVTEAHNKAQKKFNEYKKEIENTQKEIINIYKSIGLTTSSSGSSSSGGSSRSSSGSSSGSSTSTSTSASTPPEVKDVNEMMLKATKERIAMELQAEEEGTQQWKALKLEEIEANEQLEKLSLKKTYNDNLENLKEAKKQGLIKEEDYNEKKKKLEEDYNETVKALAEKSKEARGDVEDKVTAKLEKEAKERVEVLQAQYVSEQIARDKKYTEDMSKAKQEYAEDIKRFKGNKEEMERVETEFENKMFELSTKYSQDSAEASIINLKEMLKVENLSAEEKAKLQEQLAQEEINLANMKADAVIEATKREVEADQKAKDKRIANAQQWLQVASDSISAIADLADALFEGQIEKIELEQDANEEAKEKELENVEQLVEQKVITEEEGEARKRAAEAKSEQKHAELEKKKQALEYKQAVWQKATDLAQAGISTALGIMQTIASVGFPAAIPMIAVVSALGAINMATIAATPIPKYAKGTGDKGHIGGLALVGDGGKHEAVVIGNDVWVTPDTPTLVDMPKGAVVYPDIEKFAMEGLLVNTPSRKDSMKVVVNNDYRKLEKGMIQMVSLMRTQLKQNRRSLNRSKFRDYINSRI